MILADKVTFKVHPRRADYRLNEITPQDNSLECPRMLVNRARADSVFKFFNKLHLQRISS